MRRVDSFDVFPSLRASLSGCSRAGRIAENGMSERGRKAAKNKFAFFLSPKSMSFRSTLRPMILALPVVVSTPASCPSNDKNLARPAHHLPDGKGFVNPWPSFIDHSITPRSLLNIWKDWQSVSIPYDIRRLSPETSRCSYSSLRRSPFVETRSATRAAAASRSGHLGNQSICNEGRAIELERSAQVDLAWPRLLPRRISFPVQLRICLRRCTDGTTSRSKSSLRSHFLVSLFAQSVDRSRSSHETAIPAQGSPACRRRHPLSQSLRSHRYRYSSTHLPRIGTSIGLNWSDRWCRALTTMCWRRRRDRRISSLHSERKPGSKATDSLQNTSPSSTGGKSEISLFNLPPPPSLDKNRRNRIFESLLHRAWIPETVSSRAHASRPIPRCQHFSGRSINDRCSTLWASWAVVQEEKKGLKGGSVWFGGDTGFKSGTLTSPSLDYFSSSRFV